ncbi:MAG: MogA/MoaB family molybdenum cofactor biosynthesis protein [Planctomycetes bacterium]|nr:MogA/MoaB family molybdenum cofactor biosynthesis protein [Planctomycetota bacterium]
MSSVPRAAILTVSDRCSRGETDDTSGPTLAGLAAKHLHAEIVHHECLPDDLAALAAFFSRWSEPSRNIDLILSTGGTGLAPRDITPEALRSVMHREHAGIMDLSRLRCLQKTPRTFLSRGIAGTINQTLIITLPGSPRGCAEMFEAIADILPHAIETLRGEVKDDGRPDAVASPDANAKVIHHKH